MNTSAYKVINKLFHIIVQSYHVWSPTALAWLEVGVLGTQSTAMKSS